MSIASTPIDINSIPGLAPLVDQAVASAQPVYLVKNGRPLVALVPIAPGRFATEADLEAFLATYLWLSTDDMAALAAELTIRPRGGDDDGA